MAKFLIIVLFFIAACGETTAPQVEVRQAELGEPVGEFPSLTERQVLYLTNRARVEPDAFNPADPYDPTPPLRWDYLLTKAARFHAGHINEANCWCADHSSCCALEEAGDDIACGGPTTGCGAMSASDRVALWTPNYSGENMAMGQMTPQAAIDGWINSPGHWQNINSSAHSLLGAGNEGTAWVQDFGRGGGSPPVIGDGIHLSNGQSTTFGITYHQPTSNGPQTALVIVNGECHDLTLTYGTAQSGAFETSKALGPGCHRYYFYFTDGNGNDLTYPSTGSLGVGTDDCALYLEERPADTCSPSGQTCETGDTRSCYTGPFGTRDIGICTSGVERCIGGQWTGECMNEIQPESAEICDNSVDDNCDGEVDEACTSDEDDAGSPKNEEEPKQNDEMETDASEPTSDGGCSTIVPVSKGNIPGLLLIAVVATIWRRRRWAN